LSTTATPTPATIQEVVNKFNTLDDALKSVFPKVDPRTVVGLIIRVKTEKKPIYTLETVIKPDQNIDSIRRDILNVTGMAPGFYLQNTKIIVTHVLDLELLKRINDLDYVVSIKGNPYSAGGSSDF
jgi:hypothetical protein